jgi:hypothetical protein
MKSLQLMLAVLLGAANIALTTWVIVLERENRALANQVTVARMTWLLSLEETNQALGNQLNYAQSEIQKGAQTEQKFKDILTDMGNAALTNTVIRDVLQRSGYTLTTNTAGGVSAPKPNPAIPADPSTIVKPPVTLPAPAVDVPAKTNKPAKAKSGGGSKATEGVR